MKKGLIIYATVSGNTEIVCQQVAQELSDIANCDLVNCNIVDAQQITAADFLILASGTYDHGQIQRYMQSFLKKKINDIDLMEKPCAAIGLGDSKYDHIYNMEAANLLSEFLNTHNGKELVSPLQINFSPINQLETVVSDWAKKLSEKI